MASDKRLCACGWRGRAGALLDARLVINATGEEVVGRYRVCPDCKDPCDVVVACDEPGCWKTVSCGAPTAGGLSNDVRKTQARRRPWVAHVEWELEIARQRLEAQLCSCCACNLEEDPP